MEVFRAQENVFPKANEILPGCQAVYCGAFSFFIIVYGSFCLCSEKCLSLTDILPDADSHAVTL